MLYRNLNPRALGFSGTVQSEMIELALTYGFRGMDVDIVDFGQQADDFGLETARRLIDSAKLRVGNFHLPVRLQDDEALFAKDLARLPRLAELAAGLGCTRSFTAIQPASDKLPYAENFELHRQRIAAAADVLAGQGIQLGLEFLGPAPLRQGKAHPFIFDLARTLELVAAIGRPNVGVVVDTWHLYVAGVPSSEVYALPPGLVTTVHLADAPPEVSRNQLQDSERKLPGETGAADVVGVLRWLRSSGYDGPVTPEPLKGRLKGLGRQRAVKLTGEAVMNVWRAAGLPLEPPPAAAPSEDANEPMEID